MWSAFSSERYMEYGCFWSFSNEDDHDFIQLSSVGCSDTE